MKNLKKDDFVKTCFWLSVVLINAIAAGCSDAPQNDVVFLAPDSRPLGSTCELVPEEQGFVPTVCTDRPDESSLHVPAVAEGRTETSSAGMVTLGKVGVQKQSGSLSYSLSIPSLPVAGSIQPKLSLQYGSDQGTGSAGKGFGLSASHGLFESIRRCSKSMVEDGRNERLKHNDAMDGFCYQGSRLKLKSREPNGWMEYRLEDRPFMKIWSVPFVEEQEGGNAVRFISHFIVFDSNSALIKRFGGTANSRIGGFETYSSRDEALVRVEVPYVYALDTLVDTNGNSAEVLYSGMYNEVLQRMEGEAQFHGATFYPTEIISGAKRVVTFNEAGGEVQGVDIGDIEYEGKTRSKIIYEPLEKRMTQGFVGGQRVDQDKRIREIRSELKEGDHWRLIHQALLSYGREEQADLIHQVRQCVWEDHHQTCSKPLQFQWAGAEYQVQQQLLDLNPGSVTYYSGAGAEVRGGDSRGYVFGDMDGDGFSEAYRFDPTIGLVKAANDQGALQDEVLVPVALHQGVFGGANPDFPRFWGGYGLCSRGVCRGSESPLSFIDDDGDGRDELYVVGPEQIERIDFERGRYTRQQTGVSHRLEQWVYDANLNPGYQPHFIQVKGGGEISIHRLHYADPGLVTRYVTGISLRSLKRFQALEEGQMFTNEQLVSIPNARERDIFWVEPLGADGDGDGVSDFIAIGRESGQLFLLSYVGRGQEDRFRVTEVQGIALNTLATAEDEEERRASVYYNSVFHKRLKWVDVNGDGLIDVVGYGGVQNALRTWVNRGAGVFVELDEPMAEGQELHLFGIDRNSNQANTSLSFEEGFVVHIDSNSLGGQMVMPCGSGRLNEEEGSYCLVKNVHEKWHVEDLGVVYKRIEQSERLNDEGMNRSNQRHYLAERQRRVRKVSFVDLNNDGHTEMLFVPSNGESWNRINFLQEPWRLSGATIMSEGGNQPIFEQFFVNYSMLGQGRITDLYVPENGFAPRVDGRPFLPITGAGKNVVASLVTRDGRIHEDGRYGQSVSYYSYGTGYFDTQRGGLLGFDQVQVRSVPENVWSMEKSDRMLFYNENKKRFSFSGLVTHTANYTQRENVLIQTKRWDVGELSLHAFEDDLTFGIEVQAGTTQVFDVDGNLQAILPPLNVQRSIGRGHFDVRRGRVLKTERSSTRYDAQTGAVLEEHQYLYAGEEETLEQHNSTYTSYDGDARNVMVDYLRLPDRLWSVRRGLNTSIGELDVKENGHQYFFHETKNRVQADYSLVGTRENPRIEKVTEYSYDDAIDQDPCGVQNSVTRGHLIKTVVRSGLNEDAFGYQERISEVRYDAEGFMPVASWQYNEQGQALVTTFRNHRVHGKVEGTRDPNGNESWVKQDTWGRPLWSANSAGVANSTLYLNANEVPQGNAKFPEGLTSWVHTKIAGGGEGYAGYGVFGDQVYQLQRRYNENGEAWTATVRYFPFERRGAQASTEGSSIQIGPFDPDVFPVLVSSGVQSPFGPGFVVRMNDHVPVQRSQYDDFGRLIASYQPDGSVNRFSYDGLIKTKVDGRGMRWRTRGNVRGLVECIQEPQLENAQLPNLALPGAGLNQGFQFVQGREEQGHCDLSFSYDADGNKVELRVRGGVTSQGFDAQKRKLWVADEISGRTSYAYNAFGELETTLDGAGRVTTIRHDRLGRKTSQNIVGAQGGQNPRREERVWQYDARAYGLGLLSLESHVTDGVSTEFVYDANSHVSQTKTTIVALGSMDDHGEEQTESYCQRFGYDAFGRVREVRKSGWGILEQFNYDALTGVQTDIWASAIPWGSRVGNWIPQPVWQLKSLDVFGNAERSVLGNGLTQESLSHEKTGRLTELKTAFIGEENRPVQHWEFFTNNREEPAYDAAGNLTYAANKGLSVQYVYQYDSLSRLVSQVNVQQGRGTQMQFFEYDDRGNILSKRVSGWRQFDEIGPNDNVLEALAEIFNPDHWNWSRSQRYQYLEDSHDVLTEMVEQQWQDGELTEENHQYEYTELGHVSRFDNSSPTYSLLDKPIWIETTEANDVKKIHEFLYDASGRRIHKRWYEVNDGVAEIKGDKITLPGFERLRNADGQWVYRYQIGTPSSTSVQFEVTLPSNVEEQNDAFRPDVISTRYLHHDRLGSVELVTDGGGNVLEQREYGPFGEQVDVPELEGASPVTDRGYTAHEEDLELGLVNMGARFLNTELGRCLQSDNVIPDPYFSQAYNRYAYTYNNPVNHTDPTGNIPVAGFSTSNEWMMYAPITGAPGFGMNEKVFRHYFENTNADGVFKHMGYPTQGPDAGYLDYNNPKEFVKETELIARITFAGMKAGSARMRDLFMNLYKQPAGKYAMVFIHSDDGLYSVKGWVEGGRIFINLANPHMQQGWFQTDFEYGFKLLETLIHEAHHVRSFSNTLDQVSRALMQQENSEEQRWKNALIANYAEEALGFATTQSMIAEFDGSGINEVIDYSWFSFFFDGGFPSREMVYRDIFDRHSDTIPIFGDTRFVDQLFSQEFIQDALRYRDSPSLRSPLGWFSAYYGTIPGYVDNAENNVRLKYQLLRYEGMIQN